MRLGTCFALGVWRVTPEEARELIHGLDRTSDLDVWGELHKRADMGDFFDALETVAGLRTVWLICRGSNGQYAFWYYPEGRWRLGAGIASRFASRDAAIEHAEAYELEGYELATMLIGSVEVEA